jgi:hypothetical protein
MRRQPASLRPAEPAGDRLILSEAPQRSDWKAWPHARHWEAAALGM